MILFLFLFLYHYLYLNVANCPSDFFQNDTIGSCYKIFTPAVESQALNAGKFVLHSTNCIGNITCNGAS